MQQKHHNQYDITIKDLFADDTQELINFFSDIPSTVISDLKIEFPQVETRVSDLVLEAKSDQGEHLALHLEFQSQNDREMPYRMLRYALEIHKAYRLPVYQLAIYFGQREAKMDHHLHYHLGNNNRLDYRYRIIDLGKITYEELSQSPYQQLLSLLPLADRKRRQEKGEEFLRQCTIDILNSNLDQETKKSVLLRAEIFAGLIYSRQVIDLIFREVEQMLNIEESAGYKRIYEKGLLKGQEEGRLKGQEEGRLKGQEEGRQESLADVAIRLLQKKFRKLPREYVVRLKEQDANVLQQVIGNIFDINDPAELEDYLQ